MISWTFIAAPSATLRAAQKGTTQLRRSPKWRARYTVAQVPKHCRDAVPRLLRY